MNWLAKTSLGIVLAIAVGLAACEAPKEIGLPPEVLAEIKYTDTLTVRTSTVLLDSVRTTNTNQLLVGNYLDPDLGRVSARPYFELGSPFNLNAEGNTKTYVYDSLTMNISYSYLYGDTLKPFEVSLHRLNDTLRTNQNYYNNSSIPHQAAAIAKASFIPTPSLSSSFKMKLPNTLGKQIFDLSGKDEASTTEKFVKTIKGFTLIPNANNSMVIGIGTTSASIVMNLYVHESTADTVALVKSFTMAKRFNNVSVNRQGTALSQIQPLKPLTAAQTRGRNYIQDALGIVTKVEFPSLLKILENKNIAVNRAELSIVPDQPVNINGLFNLPTGVALIETDATNRVLRTKGDTELFVTADGETFQSYIRPQIALYSSKFKNYNFILTTYLQAITTGYKKSNGLLLVPISSAEEVAAITNQSILTRFTPYLNNKVNRMSITPTRNNLKLQLFYTVTQ